MKSKKDDLRKRGLLEQKDINDMKNKPYGELVNLINSDVATVRSAVVRVLGEHHLHNKLFISVILNRLKVEKSLYTKIEICTVLEKGNAECARLMIPYIGEIGNSQYSSLPAAVSKKISYPLPRDIIARTMGKMSVEVSGVLIEVLTSGDIRKLSEGLDAFGFLVFYNQELANIANARHVYNIIKCYDNNLLILWKAVICLSAFPLKESIEILKRIKDENVHNLLHYESIRSLKLIEGKYNMKMQ